MTVTGLPAGLTFTADTAGGGTISGTPSAGTGGVNPVTVTATNAGGTATQSLSISVRERPAFTSAATYAGSLNQSFSFTVTTTGYPAASMSRSGTLPKGVAFRSNGDGTATISGTPLKQGTYPLTLTAKNSVGTTTQSFSLVVR